MGKYEKTKIMMQQLLEEMGLTFNNTLSENYKPYRPNVEEYRRCWSILDLNQNCNKYRWTNLPEGIDSWNLERMLYYYGSLAGFSYNNQIYVLPFTPVNGLNCYGFPTKIQPITFNGRTPDDSTKSFFGHDFIITTFLKGDKPASNKACILLDNIPEACGTFIPVSRWIQNQTMINDIVETLKRANINIVVSNKKLVINCPDPKQAEVIRQELEKGYNSDSPFIITSNPSALPSITQSSDLAASDLFNVIKQYDAIRCQMSGILTKSFGQDKKERVNSGELMGEKEQVNIIYDVGLYLRQMWAEDMNNNFGTNIQVEENKDALEDTEDLEEEVEKNE